MTLDKLSQGVTRKMATVVAGAAMIMSGQGFAADDSGCYGAYFTSLEILQIAENHVYITGTAFGTGYVTTDPNSPLKGAAGPCEFVNDVIDGKPRGEGRCVRTDPQGDKFLISSKIEAFNSTGGMTGKWKMDGLTGKWVGATGGGEWWDAGSGKDGKHYFLCFNGTHEMKK